jgi:hypothetical protein
MRWMRFLVSALLFVDAPCLFPTIVWTEKYNGAVD